MNFDADILMIFILPVWALGFVISNIDIRRSQLYAILGATTFGFYALKVFIDLSQTPNILFSMRDNFPSWLDFSLVADGFAGIQMLLNAVFLVLITLYRPGGSLKSSLRFYFQLYMLAWSSTIVLFMTDLFAFVVAMELVFMQYLLIVALGNKRSGQNNFKGIIGYFSTGLVCSICAIVLLKFQAGQDGTHLTIDYLKDLGNASPMQEIVFWMLLFSFTMRMGIFPFHSWLTKSFRQSPPQTNLVFVGFVGKIGYVGLAKFVVPAFSISALQYSNLLCGIGVASGLFATMALWYYHNKLVKMAALFSAGMAIALIGIFSLDAHAALGSIIINTVFSLLIAAMILILNEADFSERGSKYESRFFSKSMLPLIGTVVCLPGLLIFVGEVICFFGVANKSIFLALPTGLVLALLSIGIIIFIEAYYRRASRVVFFRGRSTVAALLFIGSIFIGLGIAPRFIVDKFWLESNVRYELSEDQR